MKIIKTPLLNKFQFLSAVNNSCFR